MCKLLLVDDEKLIRDGIERMIDWTGLGIRLMDACPDAVTALERMNDEMPDILLTDVRMPGMNGLELVERARALNPRLECVILSAYDDFAYAQQALRAGAAEYLLKPCSKEDMEKTLRHVLEKKARRTAESMALRQERLMYLVKAFSTLEPDESGNITEAQVAGVHDLFGDFSLSREELIYLITHSPQGASQAEWSLGAVQGTYQAEDCLLAHAAQTLTHLRGEKEGKRPFVQQMQDFVQENYHLEELTLQYLADNVVYMTADYIGKEFTRSTGMKFSAYLVMVRMNKAKALMAAQPELHSWEIAEQIGMGQNPHYFSQIFRKYTGMSPKDYKNQKKREENQKI